MTNITCATCRHWVEQDDRYEVVRLGRNPESGWAMCETEEDSTKVFGYRVRHCTNPKIVFYQRPDENGAAVVDGSQYQAALLTAERFGCVLHEPFDSA